MCSEYIHAHTHICSNTRTHTHIYSYTHRSTGERSRSRRRYRKESKRSTSRTRRSKSRSKQESEPTKRRIEHLMSKRHGGRHDRLCYSVKEGHGGCSLGLDCNYAHSKRELELCRKAAIVNFPALDSMHYATVASVKDFGAFLKVQALPTDALLHVSDFDEDRGGPGRKNMYHTLKPGRKVWVKVLHVDVVRERVFLSMRGVSQKHESEEQRSEQFEMTEPSAAALCSLRSIDISSGTKPDTTTGGTAGGMQCQLVPQREREPQFAPASCYQLDAPIPTNENSELRTLSLSRSLMQPVSQAAPQQVLQPIPELVSLLPPRQGFLGQSGHSLLLQKKKSEYDPEVDSVYDHVESRYFRTDQTLPEPEKGHQQEIKETSENLSFDQCSSLESSVDFVVVAGLKLFMKPFHHTQATNMILPATHFPLLWCVFSLLPLFDIFNTIDWWLLLLLEVVI